MGKPFESELLNLPATVTAATRIDLARLPRQIAAALGGPVILVGAGGSLSTAEFGQKLFDQKGASSQAVTPLAFLQTQANLRSTSIFIVTASGNNKDVLAAFSAARVREARSITVLCGAKRSKIADAAVACERAYVFAFQTPAGKDGFLATNSLIESCILLARGCGEPILSEGDTRTWLQIGRRGFSQLVDSPRHYVILFSSWAKPAAIDFESKLSEAGLASSMLADFRHFAHGRHNWIDKQASRTSVIALSDRTDERLAKATLDQLPGKIPVWHCHTASSGSCASLEFLLASFGFVAELGKAAGIDPGRPGVPAYGSKLYRLGPVGINLRRTKPILDASAAIERKALANHMIIASRQIVEQKFEEFRERISRTAFGVLVTDFDGTILPVNQRNGPIPKKNKAFLVQLLEAGISVFFATGRGDSIQALLQKSFPRRLWPRIHVGYLNGAFTLRLDEGQRFEELMSSGPISRRLEDSLRASPSVQSQAVIKNKRWQISLEPRHWENLDALTAHLQEHLVRNGDHSLRLVTSSHSIDILPQNVSKANCRQLASKSLRPPLRALSIGDCGAYPGNDFELLHDPWSLSVDTVSAHLETCWNILPWGVSHSEGAEFYLSRFKVEVGHFTIQI